MRSANPPQLQRIPQLITSFPLRSIVTLKSHTSFGHLFITAQLQYQRRPVRHHSCFDTDSLLSYVLAQKLMKTIHHRRSPRIIPIVISGCFQRYNWSVFFEDGDPMSLFFVFGLSAARGGTDECAMQGKLGVWHESSILSQLFALHHPQAMNRHLSPLLARDPNGNLSSITAQALQCPSLIHSSFTIASSYLTLPPLFHSLLIGNNRSSQRWRHFALTSITAESLVHRSSADLNPTQLRRKQHRARELQMQDERVLSAVESTPPPPLTLITSSPVCHGWFAAHNPVLRFVPDLYAVENRSAVFTIITRTHLTPFHCSRLLIDMDAKGDRQLREFLRSSTSFHTKG